ncbi:MAG: hypothetical protein GY710_12095 [Desulfobacteraceae bacterium]|nr:hypothetical protein [Desulfobacteraceae bacterium]
MTTIIQMVINRLPDEAELFAGSLDSFIEESGALAGFEGVAETNLTILQKSLIADMAAKALILPSMSKYKKALSSAEGDGAGKAEFADKLNFLKEMASKLDADILEKKAGACVSVDTGIPMVVVSND